MIRTEHVDGVRLLRHRDVQEHTDVTLTFAVGARDETLRTVGVAHAVEHLVMSTVRQLPIQIEAEVDLTTTSFAASGSPARVGEFLNRLCAALADPPVDRLAVEAGVLAAEDGWAAHPMAAFLLFARYGAAGPGLTWLEGAGYDGLTAEHVASFARKWFVPGNAVLQVSGPLPDGLELRLPQGPAPSREYPVGRLLDGPSAVGYGIPGGAVLLTLPSDDAARVPMLAMNVLENRIEEQCRHVAGHSYVVDSQAVGRDFIIFAEAREGTEEAVARAVAEALTDLAAHGPSEEELTLAVARLEESLATTDRELASAFGVTMRQLMGEPPLAPIDVVLAKQVRPADIAAVLRAALPSAIGYAEHEALDAWKAHGFHPEAHCRVVPELPAGKVYKPSLTARTFFKDARSLVLVQTEQGLAVRDEDGVHEIRWDEVAGVMRTDGPTVVLGTNGCAIPVDPQMFRGSGAALDELARRTDPGLWFDESAFTRDQDDH
ncbi:hypothetical protein [Kribbella sp. CA-293567]|uniref:hypothetical protein n=1 Tax=Kribbella sp. CA-293567 TaxID=3002436 RepID=UPI0022DDA2A6|nr:hypothetical protein [Kribbella sp. CA-293567]WBQ03452.1 hypothetical protein OX958_26190 [Kribbella sp. CA-293567]